MCGGLIALALHKKGDVFEDGTASLRSSISAVGKLLVTQKLQWTQMVVGSLLGVAALMIEQGWGCWNRLGICKK